MRFAPKLIRGTLVQRYKRFLADVRLADGEIVTAHCTNTGSMLGCKEPGSAVYISRSPNKGRKLAYTWEMIQVERNWVGINTLHPNKLVAEAIAAGAIPELDGYKTIRREVKVNAHSRLDLCLEGGRGCCFIEVKNVTLSFDGTAAFPDAVSERATKHLKELMRLKRKGHRAVIVFVIQRGDCDYFRPADEIDPQYGRWLRKAFQAGVEILPYQARVNTKEIILTRPLAIKIDPVRRCSAPTARVKEPGKLRPKLKPNRICNLEEAKMITAKDLRGVLAIMPTPAKEGAERLDATNTVDLDETARLAEALVRDGATGIMALGTMGECATTSPSDYEAFVDCLLKTVRGRIPTFVGTTALGGHEITRRIKFVKERGATGMLLGIPMWQPATLDMAVEFYADVAQTFPDFPIMVYANARAFRFPFDVDFWGRIVDKAPTVMSAKFSTKGILKKVVEVTRGKVNLVPPIGLAYECAQLSPQSQTTCWMPAVGPQVGLALMKALTAGDASQSKAVADDIAWANEPHHVMTGSQEIFASYNIQMEKILMGASGYCKPGPIRPPYNVMPEDFLKAATEGGQRYAKLREKYSKLLG